MTLFEPQVKTFHLDAPVCSRRSTADLNETCLRVVNGGWIGMEVGTGLGLTKVGLWTPFWCTWTMCVYAWNSCFGNGNGKGWWVWVVVINLLGSNQDCGFLVVGCVVLECISIQSGMWLVYCRQKNTVGCYCKLFWQHSFWFLATRQRRHWISLWSEWHLFPHMLKRDHNNPCSCSNNIYLFILFMPRCLISF